MAETEQLGFIVIACPTCQEARYRSTRSYAKGEIPQASDFEALNGAPPPPDRLEQLPLCHECNAVMKPMLDTLGSGVAVTRPAERSLTRSVPVPQPTTTTLFQPEPGETIQHMLPSGNAIVVATTKRIIKVTL